MLIGKKEFDFTDDCRDENLVKHMLKLSPELVQLINEATSTEHADLSWLTFEHAEWSDEDGGMLVFTAPELKLYAMFKLDADHQPCDWLMDRINLPILVDADEDIRPAQFH